MSSVEVNNLPEGWKIEELEKLIDLIQNGISSKQNDEMIGYPVSRIETIQNSIFDKNRIKYVDADNDAFNKYKYDIGDISFSHINSYEKIGKVAIYKGDIDNLLHGVNLLRLKFNNKIYSEFGYYFFKSSLARKEYEPHIKRAINQASINQKNLKSILVPFPPLEDQQRIVAKIDTLFAKIDKAISLTENSLKQSENLLPSILKEVFEKGKADGWEEKKLGEFFKDISSGFACSKRFEKDGGYVHLRTHNISTNGVLNFDKIIEIEESKVNIRSSKIFKGDVIFNNTNSTELVGKTSYVDRDYDYGYSNHLTVIKTSEESEGKYLTYFLNHLQFTGYFMRICKKWIGQSGINTSMLKDLDYSYPPLEQQKKLVSMLDGISNQTIKTQSKLEEQLVYLKQLKSSILSKAFKGEL